jgi:HK97 family phage major capsid protein
MTDVILTGGTGSDRVTWVEKTDEAGEPAFKKEFQTFPKRSWKTVLKTAYVKKIGVLLEYSKDILEDLAGFMEELRMDAIEQINLVLDENILRGTGGGANDEDMKGVLQYAQAWSNVFGTVTKYVKNANIFDVANVGITQIAKEHHNATVLLMCESTALDMELAKDANGNYVFPMWAGNKRVKNIPVVTNELFNEGEMLIMDGSKVMLKWKRGWTLEMSDSHSENFAKEIIAVRLTGRAALRIKDTDAKAFVYVASVADAINALTEAS